MTPVFLSAALLAACGPSEKKIALSPEDAALGRLERSGAWLRAADTLMGKKLLQQTWAEPAGLPDRSQLPRALYAINQAIALIEECSAHAEETDCVGAYDKTARQIAGSLGVGLMHRRERADALTTKAEVLLAMKELTAAADAAAVSIQLEEHPYNHKVHADALYALGKFEEARAEYAQVVNGPTPYMQLMQALCLIQTKRTVDAQPLLDAALKAKPSLREDVPGAAAVLSAAHI